MQNKKLLLSSIFFKGILLIALIFNSSYLQAATNPSEQSTAKFFEKIKNDPQQLLHFLQNMPKGGDLHNHIGGASMAEHLIEYANPDHLCVNRKTLSVENTSCSPEDLLENAIKNRSLYNALIDAWSMRHFHTGKESGHDHFFATFGKYGAISSHHTAQMLAEIADRAGRQHEIYLELMHTADGNASGRLGTKVGWDPDLTALRKKLLEAGLLDIVNSMSDTVTQDENTYRSILACSTQKAQPGCNVKVRYLYQVLRENEPASVFAQLLAGFEITSRDKRFVGINMVQPEDGKISMRDYQLHMSMVGFLHSVYPNVHISLHAGELVTGLVPPEGLKFHIHSAVYIAHAERIGHGIDIALENNSSAIMNHMSKQDVMVEINLKSNDAILGVKGKDHPLPLYMRNDVPVALSTDDEGVLRSNLTEQFLLAEIQYHFSYPTLKTFIRNSIRYSFLPGENLWQDKGYLQIHSACAKDILGTDHPSFQCQTFLGTNEKAAMQWTLENNLTTFEKQYSV